MPVSLKKIQNVVNNGGRIVHWLKDQFGHEQAHLVRHDGALLGSVEPDVLQNAQSSGVVIKYHDDGNYLVYCSPALRDQKAAELEKELERRAEIMEQARENGRRIEEIQERFRRSPEVG